MQQREPELHILEPGLAQNWRLRDISVNNVKKMVPIPPTAQVPLNKSLYQERVHQATKAHANSNITALFLQLKTDEKVAHVHQKENCLLWELFHKNC